MEIKDEEKEIVIKMVKMIAFGTTQTYKQIALKSRINITPKIVGKILATNDKLIAIPCHRVIHSNGDIGGYRLGKDFKKFLLEWEKRVIS